MRGLIHNNSEARTPKLENRNYYEIYSLATIWSYLIFNDIFFYLKQQEWGIKLVL